MKRRDFLKTTAAGPFLGFTFPEQVKGERNSATCQFLTIHPLDTPYNRKEINYLTPNEVSINWKAIEGIEIELFQPSRVHFTFSPNLTTSYEVPDEDIKEIWKWMMGSFPQLS